MPELRKDLLTDNWVIIAEERGGRPKDYSRQHGWEESPQDCPFEPGHESMTPSEIDTIQSNGRDDSDWLVRVVPNKYNALSPDETPTQHVDGLFQRMNATGSHEVVIETPEHSLEISEFSKDQMGHVIDMFQRRLDRLLEDKRFQFVQIFRNEGREAGASLVHPHSQILAFPFIPLWIRDRLRASYQHFSTHENCILCDLTEQELEAESRLIEVNSSFIVLSPYAARYPFETWIIPRNHSHDFRKMNTEEKSRLAEVLPRTTERLNGVLEDPPFNILHHTAPKVGNKDDLPDYLTHLSDHFHWHMEIIPRLKQTAGLELATDTHINTVSPETAAEEMKQN